MIAPLSFNVRKEIRHQLLNTTELIRLFEAIFMPVIALRALVVVADDALAIHAVVQPVLEILVAADDWRRNTIVEWSDELRAVVDLARSIGPTLRPTLICGVKGDHRGKPLTESGFRSNWHRLMTAAVEGVKRKDGSWIAEPVPDEPFTFHDQRAKSASDEEDFEEAHDRLAHDDRRTTQKILPSQATASSSRSEGRYVNV